MCKFWRGKKKGKLDFPTTSDNSIIWGLFVQSLWEKREEATAASLRCEETQTWSCCVEPEPGLWFSESSFVMLR